MRRITLRIAGSFLLVLVIALLGFSFTGQGRTAIDFIRAGWLGALLPQPEQKYDASRRGNLSAMYKALMLYHDSEGQFPDANGWMDAIQNRIQTANMSPKEAEKKLIRPDLAVTPGAYGYAMNDAVSGKYKGDVKNPKTVLVFESGASGRNAHGEPGSEKGRLAVTVDGTILKL